MPVKGLGKNPDEAPKPESGLTRRSLAIRARVLASVHFHLFLVQCTRLVKVAGVRAVEVQSSISGLPKVRRLQLRPLSAIARDSDGQLNRIDMAGQLPKMMRKIVVTQLGSNFSQVTKLTEAPVPQPAPGELLIRNKYVGINASDVNFSAGRYDTAKEAPFDAGFEGLGDVAAVGENVANFKVGQPVAYLSNGAFADYKIVAAKQAVPLPAMDPKFLPFMLSGLTAAISLDKVAEIKKGDKVLITAAAGGTGQFAVQWCKNAGCEVIGTCSTDDKVQFLKSIGCDRPINYKKEDLNAVLKAEYPNGVNVVYESIGGAVFDTCLKNLAVGGRLMVIGAISGYTSDYSGFKATSMLPLMMLQLSASLRGFFLLHFTSDYKDYMMKLVTLYQGGKLVSTVDMGEKAPQGPFLGLDNVTRAVEFMFSGQNIGKIVVQLH